MGPRVINTMRSSDLRAMNLSMLETSHPLLDFDIFGGNIFQTEGKVEDEGLHCQLFSAHCTRRAFVGSIVLSFFLLTPILTIIFFFDLDSLCPDLVSIVYLDLVSLLASVRNPCVLF